MALPPEPQNEADSSFSPRPGWAGTGCQGPGRFWRKAWSLRSTRYLRLWVHSSLPKGNSMSRLLFSDYQSDRPPCSHEEEWWICREQPKVAHKICSLHLKWKYQEKPAEQDKACESPHTHYEALCAFYAFALPVCICWTSTMCSVLSLTFRDFRLNKTLFPYLRLQSRDFPGGTVVKNRLPMQGTWVQTLIWEDPTCHRTTKPVHHNYWACALEPTSHNYWAHVPQLLKPMQLEPVLCNKRSHRNEKPVHHDEE